MTRNLKALLAAAMALAALGAIGVTGASAAGEQFHCEIEPCRIRASQDGTLKTGHQVFNVELGGVIKAAFTCETISGDATNSTKTSKSIELTEIKYGGCTVNGSPEVVVDMNGCTYLFNSERNAASTARVEVKCPGTAVIEVTFRDPTSHALKCTIDIAGGQDLTGINYHNIGTAGTETTETTVEANTSAITVQARGTSDAECFGLPRNTNLTAHYTTGNAIATGEEDKETSPTMTGAWWA
jgi:hypothetical protein